MPNQRWNVTHTKGFGGLKLSADDKIPEPRHGEVLVKHEAASLNYRDAIISLGQYPFHQIENVIPGSDAAGQVVSVGDEVSRFKKGDRVSGNFMLGYHSGALDVPAMISALGGGVDGVMQSYRVYPENSLVKIPDYLSFEEAATLPCAALTAYNALYGLPSCQLRPGQWVLTLGTGGVSIFGLQIAKAAGARVVSTTSSDEKMNFLKKLGADKVINYKTHPEWGALAREATGGEGFHHVIEVGGPGTMKQSLASIRIGGVISIIGFVGKSDQAEPTASSTLSQLAILRPILVGSRSMYEEMIEGMTVSKTKPVVDKVFPFNQLKEAYDHLWEQKHIGKVVVKIE